MSVGAWHVAHVYVERPPIIIDDPPQLGPSRAYGVSITGAALAVEYPVEQHRQILKLRLPKVSRLQKAQLEEAMQTSGPTKVFTGTREFDVMWGPRVDQEFRALIGDSLPDISMESTVLPDSLQWWEAILTFVVIT